MPRGFGGARLLLLLPLGAVAAAPCAARPVLWTGRRSAIKTCCLGPPFSTQGPLRKKGVLLLTGSFGGVVHEEYVIAELVDVRLMSMSWRAWS